MSEIRKANRFATRRAGVGSFNQRESFQIVCSPRSKSLADFRQSIQCCWIAATLSWMLCQGREAQGNTWRRHHADVPVFPVTVSR